MMEKLLEQLAATAEMMNTQLSPGTLAMIARDLREYDQSIIFKALHNLRKNTDRFNLKNIILEIEALDPNKRLGVDEAWALYPHNEDASAVITDEIAEAMQVAYPLLQEGDKIGARMAFKDAYIRITNEHRDAGIKPKWFPSLGRDKDGREQALKQAEAKGLLSHDHVAGLLPSPIHPQLESALNQTLLLASKVDLTDEERERNREKLRKVKQIALGIK
jgi:hypothetical protein